MHSSIRTLVIAALVFGSLLGLLTDRSWASAEQACAPAVTTSTQAMRRADGAIVGFDVSTQANSTLDQDDSLTSVTFTRAANSSVQVNTDTVRVPTTIALPSPRAWTFHVQRLDVSQPFQVDYVVRDRCGDVSRFVGAGTADGRLDATMPSGPVTTATATLTSTAPATPVTAPATPTLAATVTSTTGTPAPTPTLAAPSDAAGRIVPAPARVTATFNSIGVEVPFSGDPNRNAAARLAFRRVGDTIWRDALPLWPTTDPSGAAFYGSALLLDAGTPYEVRVTITDPDGVDGSSVQTSVVTTRAETIPEPTALAPTYFVRTTGNDLADGRGVATAWRTIDKAIKDAPSGAVVQIGPGHYPTERAKIGGAATARSAPLTLVAQYPAVDANRQPTDAAQRSVIEPAGLSSPTGASDGPNPGPWRQVTLTGPKTGATHTVWQWTNSPVTDATQLGYATTRNGSPLRVANWKKDARDLASPAGWAEQLFTNLTYNYGFYSLGRDLYLRLPGDLDPNTLYLTISNGTQTALAINGPDVRISGFEIRQFTEGVDVMSEARSAIVDHNLLTGNLAGVLFRGQGSAYGTDHVVQDNRIQDANLWSVDPAAPAIPWMFIKSTLRSSDGSDYATSKIGAASETAGVTGRGGARRVVVRRNTLDGLFNGVGTGYNEGFDRYAGQDMDVYDNVMRQLADDALEPELATINFRAWNNRIDQTLTVLSTGPVSFGPVYLFLNIALQTGNDGVGRDGQGRIPGSTIFKYSGTSNPVARVYAFHNTFWTDSPGVSGGAQYASSGSSPESFWLRNNLIRATQYAFEVPGGPGSWDEDGNYFVTTSTMRGLRYGGVVYGANVQAYRAASSQGAHTNVASGFTTDLAPLLVVGSDVLLPPASPLLGGGVPVPNLSDLAGTSFQGGAPDIGFIHR